MNFDHKPPRLRDAYRLICEFKSGSIKQGSLITPTEERLLLVLAADLGLSGEALPIAEVVPLAAEADTHWNHRTMATLIELDDHATKGRIATEDSIRAEFNRACPSSWYRDIVNDSFR